MTILNQECMVIGNLIIDVSYASKSNIQKAVFGMIAQLCNGAIGYATGQQLHDGTEHISLHTCMQIHNILLVYLCMPQAFAGV